MSPERINLLGYQANYCPTILINLISLGDLDHMARQGRSFLKAANLKTLDPTKRFAWVFRHQNKIRICTPYH